MVYRSGFWCCFLIFLLMLSNRGWAQGQEEPISTGARLDSGMLLWPEVEVGHYLRTVYTDYDVYLFAEALHNNDRDWWADATVITGGPSFTVTAHIPLDTFGLAPGDSVIVTLEVGHIAGPHTGTITTDTYATYVESEPPANPGDPVDPGYVHLEATP